MGAARRRWRKHLIDVSRLLGYTIEPYDSRRVATGSGKYVLRTPQDKLVVNDDGLVVLFPVMWEAARAAVRLEGLDAGKLKPGRDA